MGDTLENKSQSDIYYKDSNNESTKEIYKDNNKENDKQSSKDNNKVICKENDKQSSKDNNKVICKENDKQSSNSYKVINMAENPVHKGRYLMDYSKKFGEPYDITDKAREHVQKLDLHRERKLRSQICAGKENCYVHIRRIVK